MLKSSRHIPAVVYRITNLVNGKFYIGVTTRTIRLRLTQHFAAATQKKKNLQGPFQRAIRKYGREAFAIEVLVVCENAEVALQEEMHLIAALKPQYNSTKGGDGCAGPRLNLSPESRARMGEHAKGNTYNLGKNRSASTIARLSEIGRTKDAARRFDRYRALGPQASSRPVVRLNDGMEYPSASAAANANGIAKSLVIEVCLRDPRRATARGMVFRYADDILDAGAELETAMRRAPKKYRMEA